MTGADATLDPAALRRRLARVFAGVPHLAYVGMEPSPSTGAPALIVGMDACGIGDGGPPPCADGTPAELAWSEACDFALRRVQSMARLLGCASVIDGDYGWPPNARCAILYRREGPTWAWWASESTRRLTRWVLDQPAPDLASETPETMTDQRAGMIYHWLRARCVVAHHASEPAGAGLDCDYCDCGYPSGGRGGRPACVALRALEEGGDEAAWIAAARALDASLCRADEASIDAKVRKHLDAASPDEVARLEAMAAKRRTMDTLRERSEKTEEGSR